MIETMKPSHVIVHIHTGPKSNVSNLKEEIAKFLEDRHDRISKRLCLRSSVRSILEEAIGGKIKSCNACESWKSDGTIDGSSQNETTETDSFWDHSKHTDIWGEGDFISVDVTRVSTLQAMAQSPTDTWDYSKMRHFVAQDGSAATSRNTTQSQNWWDRPLWAWKRNELILAHGAMLAVEMTEDLKNPILLPSQKVKVIVSNTKAIPAISASGDWPYQIAVPGGTNSWDTEKEEKIGDMCPTRSCSHLVTSTDYEIASQMCEKDKHEPNHQDGEDEQHGKEKNRLSAEVSGLQRIDFHNTLLHDFNEDESKCKPSSSGATESLANIPITLSPKDSIATMDPKVSMEHASELRLEIAIESSSIGESRSPSTVPPHAMQSLIVTPVHQHDHPLTNFHECPGSHETGDGSSQSENTDSVQKDWADTQVIVLGEVGEVDNPLSTPTQQANLQSATVSPNDMQKVEEECKAGGTEFSEVNRSDDFSDSSRPPSRAIVSSSPQLDSQGIDLSMLSQIPQELRSEARLALAVSHQRRPRKRFRPPTDSHLYKWLSSTSSKASKVQRTENPLLKDKERPSSIKDFFHTT
ncbi:unnamed protein product [Cylindrotheca closterium]|uniref:Uncharacterized protein n=1 Tax=Cylindrotheca closterium TaxID=2856 RepID=A0AAD2CXA4_9STRA|nr:unnamed protein product [Cylindrotheca closterium]